MSHDDKDPIEEFLLPQYLDRRRFLARSALAAGGLAFGSSFLAACKGKESAPAASAAAAGGSKSVKISNWPLYIDKETVPNFEKATGIHAEYTEDVNDNNEFFAKISEPLKRGQSRADRLPGRDLSCSGDGVRRQFHRRRQPDPGEGGPIRQWLLHGSRERGAGSRYRERLERQPW